MAANWSDSATFLLIGLSGGMYHTIGSVLNSGMQRQGQLPRLGQLVDRRPPGGFEEADGNTLGCGGLARLPDRGGRAMISRWAGRCPFPKPRKRPRGDPVGIVENDTDIPDAAHTGVGTQGRQSGFDPRVAEEALLRSTGIPVEIDFLIGASRHAIPPAPASLLIDQDDPVLLALVERTGWAGGDAGRIEAVLAQPGQIEHEDFLESR